MPTKATVFHYSLLMCPCDNHVMYLFAEHVCIALGVSVQEFSAQQTRDTHASVFTVLILLIINIITGYVPQARIKVDFSSDLDKTEKRNKKKVKNYL